MFPAAISPEGWSRKEPRMRGWRRGMAVIGVALLGCTGSGGSTGSQGPKGDPGAAGKNGADGVSVVSASLPPGDSHCPAGGASFSSVTGTTNACNGADGIPGSAGPTGPQGPAGPAGAAGATGQQGPAGPQGAVGPQGPPGSKQLVVKDANGAFVGPLVYTTDSAILVFLPAIGRIVPLDPTTGSAAIGASAWLVFASSDCSGTPYLLSYRPWGWAVGDGSGSSALYGATSATPVSNGSFTYNSIQTQGTCSTQSGTDVAYPLQRFVDPAYPYTPPFTLSYE